MPNALEMLAASAQRDRDALTKVRADAREHEIGVLRDAAVLLSGLDEPPRQRVWQALAVYFGYASVSAPAAPPARAGGA